MSSPSANLHPLPFHPTDPPAQDALAARVDEALRAVSALAQLTRPGADPAAAEPPVPAERVTGLFEATTSRPEVTLRLEEAAELLSVSPSTLRRWADSGRIAMQRTAGGHRRFQMADVERLRVALHGQGAEPRLIARPTDPAPAAAGLLERHAGAMASVATRAVYQGSRHGWFASDAAAPHVAEWAGLVTEALAGGDYACADRATDHLISRATRSGTSLIERHLFIERFGEVLLRALSERHGDAAALRSVRRLFGHLGHRHLDGYSRMAA